MVIEGGDELLLQNQNLCQSNLKHQEISIKKPRTRGSRVNDFVHRVYKSQETFSQACTVPVYKSENYLKMYRTYLVIFKSRPDS